MTKVVSLSLRPAFDSDTADWLGESWQCAVWGAEDVRRIIEAGERGPLTAAQRHRLQEAVSGLISVLECHDFSDLYLSPDEYADQEALSLKRLGLEPLQKFAD
jgi:hypothetical protein